MADPQAIRAYHLRKNLVRCALILFGLAYAGMWCWFAPRLLGRLGTVVGSRWSGLFLIGGAMLLIEELLTLPVSFYSGFILEHRYHLSNETVPKWLIRQVKELLVGAVFGVILLGGLYGLLWYGGGLWWLWVWVCWVLLSVGLSKLFPVLILPIFYKSTPIENTALTERLKQRAEDAGLRISGVFKLGLSAETKKPNAMLTGLGSTRRVLLSDTLLEAFELPEIETVFAHELGHHLRGHVWKGIALSAAAATLLIAAIVWRLGPYAGNGAAAWPHAVAALPQVFLVVTAIGLALRPIMNAISCRFETQCDRDALRAAGRDAYRSAFQKLADMTMADPKPSRLVEIFFYDHPPISRRLALAEEESPPDRPPES
jgi:STE24 endopeptidase